jgi:putative membrane protein insertion efficiency factor
MTKLRMGPPGGFPGGPPPDGPGWGRPGGGDCCAGPGCCLPFMLSPMLLLSAPARLARAVRRPPDGDAGIMHRAIRIYQAELSGHTPACPHTPSCSEYAAQAIERHGAARGAWLTARRLLRCRPGTRGGADRVP